MKYFSHPLVRSLVLGAVLSVVFFSAVALPLTSPVAVSAQSNSPGSGFTPPSNSPGNGVTPPQQGKIPNPLSSDVTDIASFIKTVLNNVVIPIGVVVIVISVIYSGFLFVTARGNETQIAHAKSTLLYVLIGAAVLLGATVIAEAVKGTLCDIVKFVGCP